MLISPEAQTFREEIETKLNPGFRYSEPARLLADAYALSLANAAATAHRDVQRDCLDVALQIEQYLIETLSDVRVSRADVEAQFEEIRASRSSWPSEISADAWVQLAEAKPLRDIADVVCGGGDYWEAIRIALDTAFGESEVHLADIDFRPQTLYFTLTEDDWATLHSAMAGLDEEANREAIRSVLHDVRSRTEDRFAMVVWSVQDVLNAVARARGEDVGVTDEATWEQAGVTREWVEEVMIEVGSSMSDRMTERGWEVLEEHISEADLPELDP